MRYVLGKIDECDTANDVSKSVSVLVAISWVAMAWSLVKEETIQKCFRKAGVLDTDMAVVARDVEDPFSKAEDCVRIQELINETMSGQDACPLEKYVNGESVLPTCSDLDNSTWEDTFFSNLDSEEVEEEEEDELGDIDQAENEPSPKVATYKDAILFLEEAQHFLDIQGHERSFESRVNSR